MPLKYIATREEDCVLSFGLYTISLRVASSFSSVYIKDLRPKSPLPPALEDETT